MHRGTFSIHLMNLFHKTLKLIFCDSIMKVEKAVAREQKILFEGENDNLEDRLASVDLEDPDKILEVF